MRNKNIIKRSVPTWVNKKDSSVNCTTFEQVLEYWKNKKWIEEATEELFWNDIGSQEGIDGFLKQEILINLYLNRVTGQINGYTVTNPANETSNTYIATENGTYTFKIQDVLTGKIYTKKVEVTNVDTSLPAYVPVTSISIGWTYIHMFDSSINNYTTFEKAYVILNGEKIELESSDFEESQDNKYEAVSATINYTLEKLVEEGKLTEEPNLFGTTQTFILVKDGVEYEIQVVITESKYS